MFKIFWGDYIGHPRSLASRFGM